VRWVEERPNFRVLIEHRVVEASDQRFPAAFEQWEGGFDECTVFVGEHGD
jgi:hypothetical protein